MTSRDRSSFFSANICSAKLTAFPRYPHDVQYCISISFAITPPPFFMSQPMYQGPPPMQPGLRPSGYGAYSRRNKEYIAMSTNRPLTSSYSRSTPSQEKPSFSSNRREAVF